MVHIFLESCISCKSKNCGKIQIIVSTAKNVRPKRYAPPCSTEEACRISPGVDGWLSRDCNFPIRVHVTKRFSVLKDSKLGSSLVGNFSPILCCKAIIAQDISILTDTTDSQREVRRSFVDFRSLDAD